MPEVDLKDIRQAVADYMWSEGCDCCRRHDHPKHAERLAQLLHVPAYDDDSGYNFYQFRTMKEKKS
jgi:hypothetical protein